MAYTQDQINAAYAAERANGASDADLAKAGAEKYGVTGEQFNLAQLAYGGASPTAPAAAPTSATAPTPAFGRFTQDQYDSARAWADGRSAKEILGKASELGLTNDELGYLFKDHGGSGQQVEDLTGYASRNGHAWSTAKSRELDDWSYDATSGWKWGRKSAGGGGKPTTGIGLDQLQDPTRWDVAPNETVRSQLQQIIADDSPLMQQARARAMQQANSRGLLNTSMAATAGQAALYDAAMPIATQDASTYARAGEFNANTANTFSRDNNQFVRDAFMADFNVGANEWAAQQDFERQYKLLDRQQQLTLERDAVQNGYQSARDKYMNEFQATRDSTANQWNVSAADKEAALRLQLAQMDMAARASSVQPDTSLERLRLQMEQDDRKTQAQIQQGSIEALNNLRAEYADKVFRINTSELSPEKAGQAITDLATTYNPMLKSYASKLGYDPESWIIKVAPAASAPAPAPSASAAGSDMNGAGG